VFKRPFSCTHKAPCFTNLNWNPIPVEIILVSNAQSYVFIWEVGASQPCQMRWWHSHWVRYTSSAAICTFSETSESRNSIKTWEKILKLTPHTWYETEGVLWSCGQEVLWKQYWTQSLVQLRTEVVKWGQRASPSTDMNHNSHWYCVSLGMWLTATSQTFHKNQELVCMFALYNFR